MRLRIHSLLRYQISTPAGTRILPPRPNERVVRVKTNRSGEISSIRYTTAEERPCFEGVKAPKVRFIPPKEAPKHGLNALETPPKRRKTIADVDEDVHRLDKVIIELQSSVNFINRQLSNQNTVILGLNRDLASANKKIRESTKLSRLDLEAVYLSYSSLDSIRFGLDLLLDSVHYLLVSCNKCLKINKDYYYYVLCVSTLFLRK